MTVFHHVKDIKIVASETLKPGDLAIFLHGKMGIVVAAGTTPDVTSLDVLDLDTAGKFPIFDLEDTGRAVVVKDWRIEAVPSEIVELENEMPPLGALVYAEGKWFLLGHHVRNERSRVFFTSDGKPTKPGHPRAIARAWRIVTGEGDDLTVIYERKSSVA